MAPRKSKAPKCTALKRDGTPCNNPRKPGYQTCRQHTDKPGARIKLTEGLIADAERLYAKGLTVKDASALLLVSERQHYAWQQQGEKDVSNDEGTTLAARYSQAVSRGRAKMREQMVAVIQDAAVGYTQTVQRFDKNTGEVREVEEVVAKDWRAAAFYLERTDRENWGRNAEDGQAGAGQAGQPMEVVPEDARRSEIMDVLTAALGQQLQPPAS